MLARLTLGAARLLDVRIEPVNASSSHLSQESEDEESALIVDLNAFRVFLPTFPDNSWRDLAVACGRAVAPVCTTVHDMLQADVDNVAHLLLELEDTNFQEALPLGVLEPPTGSSAASLAEETPQEPRIRRRSSTDRTIVISSSDPSIPTIIVTLSPSQPREMSCRLPLQDSAFGDLLVVPGHPTFNSSHPPCTSKPCSHPAIREWRWENGRLHAVLPSIDEQEKRRLFSRPLVAKKRNHRKAAPPHGAPAIQST